MKPVILKPAFVLVISLVILVAYQVNKAGSHTDMAFDFLPDWFFYGLSVSIGIIGIILLFKSSLPFKLPVVAVYVFLFCVSVWIYNRTTEGNKSPVILQGSTGDAVGGLCLMFRKDSTFKLLNSGGVGYDWEEGKYSMHGNKITLDYIDKYHVADLKNEIDIRGDTLYYRWKGGTANNVMPMRIVLNELNKK